MRVLVTGGAGFIGSATVASLLHHGQDVVVLDDLSQGRVEDVPSGAVFVQGDCADERLIEQLGAFDACVHFAGRIEPSESVTHPEEFFVRNVSSTFHLVRALVRSGVRRFVFSSSAAVYGIQPAMPVDEDRVCVPESPYGQTKLMVEDGLRWLAREGKLYSASLRYFNAAGAVKEYPERHVPETHLIPLALDAAEGLRDHLDLYGDDYPTPDGTCIRDYVHVLDLAEAHVLALDALAFERELTLNLGSGVGVSNREVVGMVRRVTGAEFEVRTLGRRAGDPAVAIADINRAQRVLGWRPRFSDLGTIVDDAWAARRAGDREQDFGE